MKKLFLILFCSLITSFSFGQANTYFHDRIDTTIFAVADTVGHGSNNYYATNLTPDFNVRQYVNGFTVNLFFKKGNTGSATLTLITKTGTLLTKTIRKAAGQVLLSGDIPDSTAVILDYYNGSFRIAGIGVTASSSSWLLTGNAGTVAGTNFLGTTDAIDLVFKTNNTEKARISSAGIFSLGLASTNNGSLLFRNSTNVNTLTINSGVTSASHSWTLPLAQGAANSLLLNDGAGTLSWNTGTGLFWALNGNTVGSEKWIGTVDNFDLPFRTNNVENMILNTSGNLGIGIDPTAHLHVKSQFATSATYAMKVQNSASTDIFAVRDDGLILAGLPAVIRMVSIGQGNGINTSNNANSVYVGIGIAPSVTTAVDITAVGSGTLGALTSAMNSTAVGTNALATMTTGGIGAGQNVAVGGSALSATNGYQNTAVGYQAGQNNTGIRNTLIGYFALQGSGAGEYNTAVGNNALAAGTTTSENVAIGSSALAAQTTGGAGAGQNTALGVNAGLMTTGYRNVFLGKDAGHYSIGNDQFYLHNSTLGISTEALGKTNSMMYGEFNQTVTSQFLTINAKLDVNGRFLEKQGTDAASASTLTLTYTGNTFELTGTTAVTLITSTGWQEGAKITLIANENVTITNGTATSGSDVTILLAGAGNFAMTANDVLVLVLSSTTAGGVAWREVSRTVI